MFLFSGAQCVKFICGSRAAIPDYQLSHPPRVAKNGKDRITDAEGKGDSVFLSVVFAAIATKTWNGFALASRLLDGAAELHRLMRNFTTARANGDSRDNSRQDDKPLHTLHGLLS
jgi:hypothetical protein